MKKKIPKKAVIAAVVAGVILLLALLAHVFSGDIERLLNPPPDAAPRVAQMKAKLALPAEMDGSTRLDDIRAEGRKVVYVMTIMKPREEGLDRAGVMNLYLSEMSCKSEDYMGILSGRFWLEWVYNDLDGAHLQTITVKPENCGLPE